MKETGIIMSGDHPAKILDGSKTMTRRAYGLEKINEHPDDWEFIRMDDGFGVFRRKGKPAIYVKCPYGGVGDLLWVRETFRTEGGKVLYAADVGVDFTKKAGYYGDRYKPSIHMPRWASRIQMPISSLRPERLQDITLEDCIKEGMPRYTIARGCISDNPPDPRWNFIELWDSPNGKKYPWAGNWWVWVIGWPQHSPKND